MSPGLLFVFTGPSGVGKGTVLQPLLALVPNLKKSTSVTTRPKRAQEVEGIDYFFCSQAEFQTLKNSEKLLEWAEFAGNFYGTPRQWVEDELASGFDVILEIEVEGAKQIRQQCPDAVLIFLSPPSLTVLEERLHKRATETPDKLALRLNKAKEELQEKSLFQYEVVNDKIEDAVNNLLEIVYSERSKRQIAL
jgi:guanylate kinase